MRKTYHDLYEGARHEAVAAAGVCVHPQPVLVAVVQNGEALALEEATLPSRTCRVNAPRPQLVWSLAGVVVDGGADQALDGLVLGRMREGRGAGHAARTETGTTGLMGRLRTMLSHRKVL